MKSMKALGIAVAVLLVSSYAVAQLETILKAGGIAAAVTVFGKDINKGINKLMTHTDTEDSTTKVVPILSVGKGGYLGAAQVIGPKEQVDRVQAIGQIEGDLLGHAVRLRGLIPISTKDITGKSKLDRVPNVGISAIVDFKL